MSIDIDEPYAALIKRLKSAQEQFDQSLSPEDLQERLVCPCQLCSGMRDIRKAIADYEKAREEKA